MKKFNAFTLAEVLITLGIIGVVAAMTMPTLINQTRGAEYKAAYKKGMSAIAQAVTLNQALNDVTFADAEKGTAGEANTEDSIAYIITQNTNYAKVDNGASYGEADGKTKFPAKIKGCETREADGTCTTEVDVSPNTFVYFNDGITFAFDGTASKCTETKPCNGVIDVNGLKGPNVATTDANNPKDIYSVTFYDSTIKPGNDVAAAVLYK